MSGLLAVFHRDRRRVDEGLIRLMLAAAPYRGPDGMSVLALNTVGLGHAKTVVTPEDAEDRQPCVSPRTGCVVIADARLDNRAELASRLSVRESRTLSDAELILLAYEAWGLDSCKRLLGDFAFVVWDRRQERLIAARDTSGQRALFYRVDQSTFAVASEIQQLLQDPSVPVEPNEERIREALSPHRMSRNETDGAATFFAGIQAVPAAHVLIVTSEATTLTRYWELVPPTELRYRRDDDYVDHFRDLFGQVIQSRLRTNGRIGALLSGGLDSSSVVCMAQTLIQAGRAAASLTSFTSIFDGLDCDERDFVGELAAARGFDARYIPVGNLSGRLQLEPRGFREAPNMGVTDTRDALFGAVQQAGVRVLLTGDLADSCVGGTRYVFDSLLRKGSFRKLYRHLRAYRRLTSESRARTAIVFCLAPLLPLALQKQINLVDMRRQLRPIREHLLPSWMPEPLREDLTGRYERAWLGGERNRRFSNPTREAEYRMLYPPDVARHPVPWPIEIWRPFADRRLHEFLLAIPPEQKFQPHPDTHEYYAGSKWLVRRAMRGIVPDRVRTRTSKTEFSAVWESEVARHWPLYEAAFGPSARPDVAARGYIDQVAFWTRLQEIRSHGNGSDAAYVSYIVELETWLRSLRLPRPQAVTVTPSTRMRDPSIVAASAGIAAGRSS